jgi:hypothetical protein
MNQEASGDNRAQSTINRAEITAYRNVICLFSLIWGDIHEQSLKAGRVNCYPLDPFENS